MAIFPTTASRVRRSTADAVNRRIAAQTERNVRDLAAHPEAIGRRLVDLDREWDIERVLETNASALALTGVVLAGTVDRRFLLLPGLVAAFLLQHALQGWCPPVPLFRRLGIRTAAEIAQERYALKALRGDFRALADAPPADPSQRAEAALEAARSGAASG